MHRRHAPRELPHPTNGAEMYLAAILDKLTELGDRLAPVPTAQPEGEVVLQEPAKPGRRSAKKADE